MRGSGVPGPAAPATRTCTCPGCPLGPGRRAAAREGPSRGWSGRAAPRAERRARAPWRADAALHALQPWRRSPSEGAAQNPATRRVSKHKHPGKEPRRSHQVTGATTPDRSVTRPYTAERVPWKTPNSSGSFQGCWSLPTDHDRSEQESPGEGSGTLPSSQACKGSALRGWTGSHCSSQSCSSPREPRACARKTLLTPCGRWQNCTFCSHFTAVLSSWFVFVQFLLFMLITVDSLCIPDVALSLGSSSP